VPPRPPRIDEDSGGDGREDGEQVSRLLIDSIDSLDKVSRLLIDSIDSLDKVSGSQCNI
jgi:hypothetical protein